VARSEQTRVGLDQVKLRELAAGEPRAKQLKTSRLERHARRSGQSRQLNSILSSTFGRSFKHASHIVACQYAKTES
jgi:hypothetical protein